MQVMIVVTFMQTIAILLELEVEWPAELRSLMQKLNIFNINIELARPECSFKFGFAEKLQYTLLLPVLIGVVLAMYALVKLLLAWWKGEDRFKKGHGGQTPVQFLTGQVVMILSAVFVFLSVFFLRTGVPRKCLHHSSVSRKLHYESYKSSAAGARTAVFQAFNCERDFETQLESLKADPEITCDTASPEYSTIYLLGYLGLTMYCAMFSGFIYGCFQKRDLFGFLGNASRLANGYNPPF